jgi:hypothetical protein
MKSAFLIAAFAALTAFAGEPQPDRGEKSPAFADVKDDPALPRVLLIGDSISIDYTVLVRKALEGKANVHRVPENGGPTINGTAKIDKWLGKGKWDVIHFNWGLHDIKLSADDKHQVEIDAYEKNLRELVAKMKATGATLIWASTTPVPEGNMTPPRKSADVPAYNAVAKKVMDEEKIVIDDLYALVLPKLAEYQRPGNVHFLAKGSEALAAQVSSAIQAALPKK